MAIEEREVLLVGAHRQDQALLRYLEVLLLEAADVDGGPFHQRRDLVEQRSDRGLGRRVLCKRGAQLPAARAQRVADAIAARLEGADDAAALEQLASVAVGGSDLDDAVALEAMAFGEAAGVEPQHAAGQDVLAMEHRQAVRRPHEAYRGGAVGQLVAHDLRYRQRIERLHDQRLDDIREHRAGCGRVVIEALLLAVGGPHQGLDRRALLLGPFLQRHRRAAFGIDTDGHRRALQLQLPGRCLAQDIGQHDCQAPRRAVDLRRRCRLRRLRRRQPMGAQLARDRCGEGVAQLLERARRKFLGEQFDEQRGLHRGSPSAARMAAGNIGNPSRSRES